MIKKLIFAICFVSCVSPSISKIDPQTVIPIQQNLIASQINKKCRDGMIEINGEFCPNLEETCLKYRISPEKVPKSQHPICLEFKNPTVCKSKTVHLNFCIDEYPFPNDKKEKPKTLMTWYDAKKACEDQGKRLCEIKEFQQACRGPENKPYPYGYIRDCGKCNCDRTPWIDPETHSFEEVDKRISLGEMQECKSDYGVYDLVGNNDRWVINESGKPYVSALVGGHAIMGARNACSPKTLVHGPEYKGYITGTVCCSDTEK